MLTVSLALSTVKVLLNWAIFLGSLCRNVVATQRKIELSQQLHQMSRNVFAAVSVRDRAIIIKFN